MTSQQLYTLAYVSSATVTWSADDLELLLAEARVWNSERDITGVLLHSGGNFMQVLEGPEAQIDAAFRRIRASKRHAGILELYREPAQQREFGKWAMAYRGINDQDFQWLRQRSSSPSAARDMLREFWSSQR